MPLEHFRGYPVKMRRVRVAGEIYDVLGPANYEELIDDPRVQARFDVDEYMPYWAEFWPASILLAEEVARWPRPTDEGAVLLELGCGLGLASLVALRRGWRVIASDYDDDALAFVAESARRSGLPAPETRFIDWREVYPDLRIAALVAAEVLYETRNLRPIAEFVQRHLRPDGQAVICDAQRTTADAFDGIARHCGLSVSIELVETAAPEGGGVQRARLFRVRKGIRERGN